MESNIKTTFYVLQQGAVQEEPWEWADIESMCGTGTFSAETLIFFPDENQWKKAGDTDLVSLFPEVANITDDDEPNDEVLERYGAALSQIGDSPGDWSAQVDAATIAAEMGDNDKAVEHYQAALDIQPYHPRIAQEAKRNLSPHVWRTLRRLERVQLAWEDLGELAVYPLSRGPLFVGIPAAVLAALSFIPIVNLLLAPLGYLMLTQAIYSSAQGEKTPPLWNRSLCEPMTLIVKPLIVGLVVNTQLAVPFVALAMGVVLAGLSGEKGFTAFLASSPILIVVAATLLLVYLPATVVIAGSGRNQLQAMNPAYVIRAIKKMERDYFTAIGLNLAMVALWGGVAFLLDFVPVLGEIWTACFGVYFVLINGNMLGTLYRRHQDQLS